MQHSAQPAIRNKKQGGFTLIELMIVVAIIGVLASIAVPQYQNYTARAQASEGLTVTAGMRTDIAEQFSLQGEMPGDDDIDSLIDDDNEDGDSAGRYVKNAAYTATEGDDSTGTITVTFNDDSALGDGATMILETQNPQEGWVCKAGSGDDAIDESRLPAGCKE